MKNPVIWFEIIGRDASALHTFYGEVFGWKLTPAAAEMGHYSMLAEQGPNDRGAGGGIGGGSDSSRVSVYVEVDDPQRYLERATKAGATVIMPVTQITPHVTIGMFRDPAGNTTGIMKANPRPAVAKSTTRKKTTARRATAPQRTTARKRTTASRKSATARKRTAARGSRRR